MTKIEYEMKSVTDKKEKITTSIFDPIIDEFMKSDNTLVEITVENRTPSYMKSSLAKRIEKREIANVEVTLGYGVVYLEKTDPT